MNISTVYTHYHIMPSLQLHMYRVASVASMIADDITKDVEKECIISACLLHDMGNILKFKFDVFPDFLEPEGAAYWQQVQNQYKKRYGVNEDAATLQIAAELGVSERTQELIEAIGFRKAPINAQTNDFSAKICMYADTRVQPRGVTSMKERLEDGKQRYEVRKSPQENAFFDEMAAYLADIETQIFTHCSLKPEDITEDSIQPSLEQLKDFILV